MYFVIINEQYFPVRDEVINAVRNELLDSARRGGGFVTFGDGSSRLIEVRVTPSTSVRIQNVEAPGPDADGGGPSTPDPEGSATDVDWWLEWS